jgi:hypothetical protein
MKTEMRRVLAREPYEKKIQKVEQLLRLVWEFPRQLKVSPATRAKCLEQEATEFTESGAEIYSKP